MAYRNYNIIYEDENDINEEIRIIIVGETKNDWE